jgi:hypothetical protein
LLLWWCGSTLLSLMLQQVLQRAGVSMLLMSSSLWRRSNESKLFGGMLASNSSQKPPRKISFIACHQLTAFLFSISDKITPSTHVIDLTAPRSRITLLSEDLPRAQPSFLCINTPHWSLHTSFTAAAFGRQVSIQEPAKSRWWLLSLDYPSSHVPIRRVLGVAGF